MRCRVNTYSISESSEPTLEVIGMLLRNRVNLSLPAGMALETENIMWAHNIYIRMTSIHYTWYAKIQCGGPDIHHPGHNL